MKVKLTVAAFVFFGLVMLSTAGTDTAKKLIGVWEVTKENGKPPKDKAILEYTSDGKYTLGSQKGTYTVKGDSVTRVFKVGEDEFVSTDKIKKLTETELHAEFLSSDGKSVFATIEYKRVKK
jgi:uncharacterized protein (TIGR03066 family)